MRDKSAPGSDVSGFRYRIDGSEIIVRNRPRNLCMLLSKTHENSEIEDTQAYLSVTDTFVKTPSIQTALFAWVPWNEDRKPTPEIYYATNRVLYYWLQLMEPRLTKVQIFCDGGTHRSVTIFGAYLRTYYNERAEEIVAARENLTLDTEGRDFSTWANPLKYIDSYLAENPEDLLLFKEMKKDSKIGRLDNYSRSICRQVQDRYGIKNGI